MSGRSGLVQSASVNTWPCGASGQGSLISGGLPADRFLMGLLRACADGPVLRGERVRWSDLGTIPLEALGAPRALHVMEDS